jgi:hypothetical protein
MHGLLEGGGVAHKRQHEPFNPIFEYRIFFLASKSREILGSSWCVSVVGVMRLVTRS